MQHASLNLSLDTSFQSTRKTWHLVIFISMSLLLHLAFLLAIRTPTIKLSSPQRKSLTVFFVAPPVSEYLHSPDRTSKEKQVAPAPSLTSPPDTATIVPLEAIQAETITRPDTPKALNLQQLLESSHNIARDEARKTEQHSAVLEKVRLNTPAGLLEQYMKLPHKEIRLADGTLKIITAAGSVCFKPVPEFASGDIEKGIFRVASTCP